MSRAFVRYLLVGGFAYSVDVFMFGGLNIELAVPVVPANIAARAVGAVTAFLLNHLWTFRQPLVRARFAGVRYLGLWLINTLLSTTLLQTISEWSPDAYQTWLGKAVIEWLLVSVNFIICKFWVFKSP
jgi:putative flippase GtrA